MTSPPSKHQTQCKGQESSRHNRGTPSQVASYCACASLTTGSHHVTDRERFLHLAALETEGRIKLGSLELQHMKRQIGSSNSDTIQVHLLQGFHPVLRSDPGSNLSGTEACETTICKFFLQICIHCVCGSICMCMYVCMYVCMCVYVCMYVVCMKNTYSIYSCTIDAVPWTPSFSSTSTSLWTVTVPPEISESKVSPSKVKWVFLGNQHLLMSIRYDLCLTCMCTRTIHPNIVSGGWDLLRIQF